MAERQGFEPWEDLRPLLISSQARSTAPAPLRSGDYRLELSRFLGFTGFQAHTRMGAQFQYTLPRVLEPGTLFEKIFKKIDIAICTPILRIP